jgi:hypothetical protein
MLDTFEIGSETVTIYGNFLCMSEVAAAVTNELDMDRK